MRVTGPRQRAAMAQRIGRGDPRTEQRRGFRRVERLGHPRERLYAAIMNS